MSFESLEPRMMLASDLYVTEFSASNDSVLDDGDGNSSDWIEVFNTSLAAIDLEDYYLTDDATDLTKWNLPAISLGSGEFLVVFASGQETDNYVDAGGNYHTNFKLSKGGEYLASVYEDPSTSALTVVNEFSPEYPEQFTDISYGLAMTGEVPISPAVVSVETDFAPFGFPNAPYTPTFDAGGPSSTDLLHGLSPSASSGNFESESSTGTSVLTDGSVSTFYGTGFGGDNHTAYATGHNGNSVTYTLPSATDVESIVIYGGWSDGGRDQQHYEIEVSTNSGSSYTLLSSVDVNPGIQGTHNRPVSNRISFSPDGPGVLVADATNIRINFLSVENGYTGYTEIDVFGATSAVTFDVESDFAPPGPPAGTPYNPTFPSGGPSSSDLLHNLSPTASSGDFTVATGGGLPVLTDGAVDTFYGNGSDGDYHLAYATAGGGSGSGTSVTYDLGAAFDLSEIVIYGGWGDGGRDAQEYEIEVSSDFGGAYTTLSSVDVNPGEQGVDDDPVSTRVSFTNASSGPLASSVTNIRINFFNAENGYTGYTEVDVFGVVTNAISEIVEPLEEGFFNTATPGFANEGVFQGFVADTKFSVDRGFYTSPISLAITSDTVGATIVYTTDGSVPTVDDSLNVTNGTLYTGEINISSTTNIRAAAFKETFAPTNVDTHTYVFLDDVINQTAASQEAALEQGLPSNAGNGVDFGLDSDILNSFSDQDVKDSLLSLPTISLTIENADFLGTSGIYTNSTISGPSSERPVSAELINPDGSPGFQINAGIRIQGAASRSYAEKYSFRLAFRGKYGPTDLVYPLFGDGVDKFDTVVLRSVFNDGYGWDGDDGNLREQQYVRDLWFRETQLAMGQPASRGNWAHLYVNGQYWGLYHPSERPDSNFAQETLGGDNDDYDAINHGGVIDDASENDPSNNVSATTVYNTGLALAGAVNSASGTTNKYTAYQKLQGNLVDGTNDPSQEDYLDVENYIDYLIVNMFGGNDDWPSNNWYTNRLRGPESEGYRFFAWDSEISLSLSTRTNVFEDYTGVSGGAAAFYSILRNYEEFRVQFGDQIHRHMFNDGVLAGDKPADRYEALALPIRDAIIGESARWGDQHFTNDPQTQAEWDAELNRMLTSYFVDRPAIALSQFRSAGLYPGTDAPEFLIGGVRQSGGTIVSGAVLSFENPAGAGTIYYTTDGSDPRLVGGAVNGASAMVFSSDLPLTDTTSFKARTLLGGEWSALTEGVFAISPALAGSFVVTELNYNPYDALTEFGDLDLDNDQFEFIELRNTGTEAIDLAGVQLVEVGDDGVSFTFSPQVLNPNDYVLVVRNESAFESRYGLGLNVAGEYSGSLSNGGELVTLRDASGSDIQTFTYDDSGSWPGRADGTGSSLEIVDTLGDYDNDDNWRSSGEFGGSPGVEGAGQVRDVIVNEVLSHSDGSGLDLIELYNTTGSTIDVNQWYLSDSNNNLFKYQFAGSTTINSGEYLVLDESQFGFALDGQFGEDVWLLEGDSATGKPVRFANHIEFDATDTDVSLGRWNNGDPNGDFFPMTSQTFGSANSGPVMGEVVISEVHYNPAPVPPAEAGDISQGELEFVELANTSDTPVDISNWKVDSIDFTFPVGTLLAANEAIVLVTFDPALEPVKAAAFRSVFGIGAGPRLFGAASGKLNNSGERVKLLRPEDPVTLLTGDVLVDAVRYDELAPWPTSADGGGDSLQRTTADSYGGFVTSWQAAPGTPGSADLSTTPSADFDGDLDIDGSDFLAWQRGFGTLGTATPEDGDADGDHNVDATDLGFWISQYGTSSVLLAAASAPEAPAALAHVAVPAVEQILSTEVPSDSPLPLDSIAAMYSTLQVQRAVASEARAAVFDASAEENSESEEVLLSSDDLLMPSLDSPQTASDLAIATLYGSQSGAEQGSSNRESLLGDLWDELGEV